MSTEDNSEDNKLVYLGRGQYPAIVSTAPVRESTSEQQEQENQFLNYWRVLVSRRWTLAAIIITFVAAALIYTMRQTPIYRATTTIQTERESSNALDFTALRSEGDYAYVDYTLQSYYKNLSSRSLARLVVEDLKGDLQKELQANAVPPGILSSYVKNLKEMVGFGAASPTAEPDLDPLRPLVDQYVDRITVSPVRNSWLVQVSFDSRDRVLATRVINTHVKRFIEQNIQNRFDATAQASEFLKGQLASMKINLEKADDQLQQYSRDHQIQFTEEGRSTAAEAKLTQLQEEAIRAQTERFSKESFDLLVRAGNADSLPQMSNELMRSLASERAQLQREESELAVTFKPDYPALQRIRSKVGEIEKSILVERDRIVRAVQADYSAAVERERLITASVEQQVESVNRMNQEIIQYNILKREVDSNREIYDGMLTRLKEAGISAGLRASNIRVVDAAEVPKAPIRPNRTVNLSLGLFFGLVFGVGFVLFQEYIDNSLKSPDDITKYLGLATLGTVPKIESVGGKRSKYGYGRYGYGYGKSKDSLGGETENGPKVGQPTIDLAPFTSPSSIVAESYRSIRTSLLLSTAEKPPKTILVTSALPSEGKTSTAVNTAIALTQTGARVVLIDADMRRPRVNRIFNINSGVGLSGILTGTASIQDAINETIVPNLYVLPCGPIPPNPAELILSGRLKQLIAALAERFDFVILDSPPISNVSDGRILATSCDAAILVVKAFSTSRHLALRALQYLESSNVRVAGAVLNDLDLRMNSIYSGYYRKGYSYNHAYYGYIQNSPSEQAHESDQEPKPEDKANSRGA